jgi:hypothetical protein
MIAVYYSVYVSSGIWSPLPLVSFQGWKCFMPLESAYSGGATRVHTFCGEFTARLNESMILEIITGRYLKSTVHHPKEGVQVN